ncbi:UDP-glucose 6-dehydrogenase TuaD [Candidatus Sulfobium mesophilum]|uniref:UDP-glucose 6-dehydrogenase n=1 Tax=Candidatus Sulfobium mesophilum TaxID=2016548 RepID=A0A2U3QJH6_9BACT|nr:UDP-glucose 6-dehydrogenase TuaD [Candidatus Sulfobium mesophilum]
MHIGIIGTGYVGLVTGACFAEFGVFVTCIDKDEKKVSSLRKGIVPFYEPGLNELVKRNLKNGRLKFSTRIRDAVESSLAVFIAVGTPPRGDGSADMSYVEEVAAEIAREIKGYKVIVTKSTVPVGTGARLRKIISKKLTERIDFDIVSNPEFLREGSAIEDFMRPNRVVLGASSQQAVAILKDLYRPLYLIETPFVITNIETAELIKYASNSFLAVKISFINELSRLCEKVGADVQMVAKGMGLDHRIGSKFLHTGPGYGGSCFPKDTRALLTIAEQNGSELGIVQSAVAANEKQMTHMIDKIKKGMGSIKGKTFAVLGLSFKPNTNDMREAPAVFIIERLLKEKAVIRAFDPIAIGDAKQVFGRRVYFAEGVYDCAKGADAVIIITEWNEFRNLELPRVKKLLRRPYFFDLRNIYEPEKMKKLGFKYFSVGRS